MLVVVDMGCLRGHPLLLGGTGTGEEFFTGWLQYFARLQDFAAEHETTLSGYFRGAREFDAIGEDYADAGRTGTACPASAVRVHCRFVGEIEAEYMGDAGDVEAPGTEVARKQVAEFALRKTLERDVAGLLFHPRMYGSDREAEGG